MIIKVNKKHGVYIAKAFDEDGNEIDRISGLSKPSAKRLLEEKLGIRKKKPGRTIYKKVKKPKNKAHGLMLGLLHVTTARNWKKVK